MSNTHKHKGKGYFHNGIKDKPQVKKYLNHCKRRNREREYFKPLELKLKEEIADIEMNREITENDNIFEYICNSRQT